MTTTERGQRRARKFRMLGILLLLSIPFLRGDAIPFEDHFGYAVNSFVHPYQFDLIGWEANALWTRLLGSLGIGEDDAADSSSEVVREYLDLSGRIIALEERTNRAISRDEDENYVKALLGELRSLREQRASLENRAESVLVQQASMVLLAEGFGWDLLGSRYLFPPAAIELESLPTTLVVSPRERIELAYQQYLQPGLPVDRREEIEDQVDALGVSSLVTGIGGLSTYPTMIVETPSLEFTVEVVAHEWVHHYLAFRPLGWHYFDSYFMRKTNETVADIAGREIGQLVYLRYYASSDRDQPSPQLKGESEVEERFAAFDFNAAMRETRRTVDALLAEGEIEDAEIYMEERRQELVRQGYFIRKLNQAYFAFHGSYTDAPSSIDPLGFRLKELRSRSGTLKEFIDLVGQASTEEGIEELFAAYGIPKEPSANGSSPWVQLWMVDGDYLAFVE